jgi:hypothetical protein
MLPSIPTLSLVFALVVYWSVCRLYGWRATLSPTTFLMFFVFGCVASTLLALYLEAIPTPFALQSGTGYTAVDPATWLVGPFVEEVVKALPLFVLAAFVPFIRRLSIADFTLVGFSTGLGFGFVEDNLSRVLSSELFRVPWANLWSFGFGAAGHLASPELGKYWAWQYLTYGDGHWAATALVGLGLGIGIRLWPDRYWKWLPGVLMLLLVTFDHSMWNFKQQHQFPNSFDLAPMPIEWLYVMTLHGFLEVAALPVLLILAMIAEGWGARRSLATDETWLLPDERGGPFAFGEATILMARAKLGRGALLRTMTYFRHRRALELAVAAAATNPDDQIASDYATWARARLNRERTAVAEPAPSPWLPTRDELVTFGLVALQRYRLSLAVAVLSLLLFALAPQYLPWLHGPQFRVFMVVIAAAFVIWRVIVFLRLKAPDPRDSDGERLVSHRMRAMLLGASATSTGIALLAVGLRWPGLVPGAVAFVSKYFGGWAAAGGSPDTLIALGAVAGAAAATPLDPKPPCADFRRDVAAGADRLRALEAKIYGLSGGENDTFEKLLRAAYPGADILDRQGYGEPGCILIPPIGYGDRSPRPWLPFLPPRIPNSKSTMADGAGNPNAFQRTWNDYKAERAAQTKREAALAACTGQSILDQPLGADPVAAPLPDDGDLHTREKAGTGTGDPQKGRDAANKPPADDLQTREKPGTGTGDPGESRDAANKRPTDDLHTREKPGTGTGDPQQGRNDANYPSLTDQTRVPATDYAKGLAQPTATDLQDAGLKELWDKVQAGDPQARDTWKTLMGSSPEAAAQNAAQSKMGRAQAAVDLKEAKNQSVFDKVAGAVLGPVAGTVWKDIGGSETVNELGNLNWNKEVADTEQALKDQVEKRVDSLADTLVALPDQAKDALKSAVDTTKKAVTGWDADQAKGLLGYTADQVVNKATDMADRLQQTVTEAPQKLSDAAGAVTEKVADVVNDPKAAIKSVVDTVSNTIKSINDAKDQAVRDLSRADPNAVRDKLADGTVEVGNQAAQAVLAEGAAATLGKGIALIRGGEKVAEVVEVAKVARGTEQAAEGVQAVRTAGTAEGLLDDARTGGKVVEGLESGQKAAQGAGREAVSAEERAIATAKTEVNPALRETEIGAGRTTVNEPMTGDGKPMTSLTQEEKNIAAAKTQRTPAATPQGDPAAVDPKAPTGPVPTSAPAERLTGDGKPMSQLTQEEKDIAAAKTQRVAPIRESSPAGGDSPGRAARADQATVVDGPKAGPEVSAAPPKPTAVPSQDEKAIFHTSEDGKHWEHGGGEVNADGSPIKPSGEPGAVDPKAATGSVPTSAPAEPAAPQKTTQFGTSDMPGDKPTGPRGTEVLEPKDLPDGGKTPAPGVERGPDGRHPIRMTREEARTRLGENIEPATPAHAGAEAPVPESPRDLPSAKLPETIARPRPLPETAASARPELPETAVRPAPQTAEGPITQKLPEPEMPKPAHADELSAPFQRALDPDHVPQVSEVNMQRYEEAVVNARTAAGGNAGPCEAASASLQKQLGGDVIGHTGKLAGAIDHEYVLTKEGLVLDPVARQAIEQRLVTAGQIRAAGLTNAVNKGVFTPAQWEKFNSLGRGSLPLGFK